MLMKWPLPDLTNCICNDPVSKKNSPWISVRYWRLGFQCIFLGNTIQPITYSIQLQEQPLRFCFYVNLNFNSVNIFFPLQAWYSNVLILKRLLLIFDSFIVGDGIPVELFRILKDDAVKVLHSICQQIWKTQQCPQDWKRSVFIPIPKKSMPKNAQTTAQLHSSHMLAK